MFNKIGSKHDEFVTIVVLFCFWAHAIQTAKRLHKTVKSETWMEKRVGLLAAWKNTKAIQAGLTAWPGTSRFTWARGTSSALRPVTKRSSADLEFSLLYAVGQNGLREFVTATEQREFFRRFISLHFFQDKKLQRRFYVVLLPCFSREDNHQLNYEGLGCFICAARRACCWFCTRWTTTSPCAETQLDQRPSSRWTCCKLTSTGRASTTPWRTADRARELGVKSVPLREI